MGRGVRAHLLLEGGGRVEERVRRLQVRLRQSELGRSSQRSAGPAAVERRPTAAASRSVAAAEEVTDLPSTPTNEEEVEMTV